MRIGELSKLSGLAASRIRFYEGMGLMQAVTRKANGYREYAPEALVILEIVANAQSVGFSLEQVRRLLPLGQDNWKHDELLKALKQKVADIEAGVLGSVLEQNPLAEAKLRGQIRRKELLEAEGGVIGPEELGNLLGITRQSVDKRRKTGTLLALEIGNRFVYPVWQIEGNKTLDDLEDVLAALKDHHAWRKLSFFVHGNVRLGGRSPCRRYEPASTKMCSGPRGIPSS